MINHLILFLQGFFSFIARKIFGLYHKSSVLYTILRTYSSNSSFSFFSSSSSSSSSFYRPCSCPHPPIDFNNKVSPDSKNNTVRTTSSDNLIQTSEILPIDNIIKLNNTFYRILGQNPSSYTLEGTNTYLIVTKENEKNVLHIIDTSDNLTVLKKKSKSNELKDNKEQLTYLNYLIYFLKKKKISYVKNIFLTHYHNDHQGNLHLIYSYLKENNYYPLPFLNKKFFYYNYNSSTFYTVSSNPSSSSSLAPPLPPISDKNSPPPLPPKPNSTSTYSSQLNEDSTAINDEEYKKIVEKELHAITSVAIKKMVQSGEIKLVHINNFQEYQLDSQTKLFSIYTNGHTMDHVSFLYMKKKNDHEKFHEKISKEFEEFTSINDEDSETFNEDDEDEEEQEKVELTEEDEAEEENEEEQARIESEIFCNICFSSTSSLRLPKKSLFKSCQLALLTGDTILGRGSAVFENLSEYMRSLELLKDLVIFSKLKKNESSIKKLNQFVLKYMRNNIKNKHERKNLIHLLVTILYNNEKIDILCPGHGLIQKNCLAKIKEYINNRNQRERQVMNHLQIDVKRKFTSWQLMLIIYKENNLNLILKFSAQASLIHHLNKLLEEGVVHYSFPDLWYINRKKHFSKVQ